MKKRTKKQLTLGKITIANLSKEQQQVLLGGLPNLTRTNCGLAPCNTPNTTKCTTRYLVCGC